MPGGDAQRVWFPEMLEELKRMWSSAMTWEELVDFCQRITEKRKSIRQTKGIKPHACDVSSAGRSQGRTSRQSPFDQLFLP